jgi:hypothetical protein
MSEDEVMDSDEYSTTQKQIYPLNALVHDYYYQTSYKLGLRLSYEDEEIDWTPEILYLNYLTQKMSLIQFKLSYNFTQALQGSAGFFQYQGSDDTSFEALESRNSVFTKLTFWF